MPNTEPVRVLKTFKSSFFFAALGVDMKLYLAVLGFVLVLFGCVQYYQPQEQPSFEEEVTSPQESPRPQEDQVEEKPQQDQTLEEQNVSTQPEQQENITETPQMMETSVVEVDVAGTEFSFDPSSVVVRKGDTVKITLKNVGNIPHNLNVEGYGSTRTISPGEQDTLEFVADKGGSFVFYCTLPGHRERGMVGELLVEEI